MDLPLCCPTCKQPLDPTALRCPNGHTFTYDNGVLVLLTPATAERLAVFAARVAEMRRERQLDLPDPAVYPGLPCALAANPEWRWRCRELAVVRAAIAEHGAGRLRVLDVGAYNGWLSHQLAQDGHEVTAVEYFVDEFDGLGAGKHYPSRWQAIQLDLVDLAPLADRFDVVIMNHGLHFFPNPQAQVAQLLTKVAPGGLLLLLGLLVYRDPRRRRRQVAAAARAHEARYGQPLLFRPAPGYLDGADRAALQQLGLTFRPCPGYRWSNLLSRWLAIWPWRGYGLRRF